MHTASGQVWMSTKLAYQRLGATVFLAAALIVSRSSAETAILAAVAAFIVGIVLLSSARVVLTALTLTLPYALGAYVGAIHEIRFYPRPVLEGYWIATREQLIGLLLAAAIAVGSGAASVVQRRFVSAVHNLSTRFLPARARSAARTVAILAGLWDLSVVVRNLSVASTRHALDDKFVIGHGGPFGIILALSVTLLLGADILGKGLECGSSAVALLLFWLPNVAVGNRNYFSVSVVGLTAVYVAQNRTRIRKTLVLAVVAFSAYGFSILPALFSANERVGWNEWILPNSIYIPMRLGLFDRRDLGVTDLLQQWQLLIPVHALRTERVTVISQAFADLKVTNVSVGGSPWADTFLSDAGARILLFAVVTNAMFLLGAYLGRWNCYLPVLTFGLMCFWGRSLVWNTVFLLCWFFLLTLPLVQPMGRTRRKHPKPETSYVSSNVPDRRRTAT